jgi:hypothetical protein
VTPVTAPVLEYCQNAQELQPAVDGGLVAVAL